MKLRKNQSTKGDSEVGFVISLFVLILVIGGAVGIVFRFADRSYDRVDQQIDAENIAASEYKLQEIEKKVVAANTACDTAKLLLTQGKDAEATEQLVKYERLQQEVTVQVKQWERMKIQVPTTANNLVNSECK